MRHSKKYRSSIIPILGYAPLVLSFLALSASPSFLFSWPLALQVTLFMAFQFLIYLFFIGRQSDAFSFSSLLHTTRYLATCLLVSTDTILINAHYPSQLPTLLLGLAYITFIVAVTVISAPTWQSQVGRVVGTILISIVADITVGDWGAVGIDFGVILGLPVMIKYYEKKFKSKRAVRRG